MTPQEQKKVVDRLLFAALTIPASERSAFVQNLANEVLNSLLAKGYTDEQILVARQQFVELIQESMQELRAKIPHGEGHA